MEKLSESCEEGKSDSELVTVYFSDLIKLKAKILLQPSNQALLNFYLTSKVS